MSASQIATAVEPMCAIGLSFVAWPRHLVVSEAATPTTTEWAVLRLGCQLVGPRLLSASSDDELHEVLDELLAQEDIARLFGYQSTVENTPESDTVAALSQALDYALAFANKELLNALSILYPSWVEASTQFSRRGIVSSPGASTANTQTLAQRLLDTTVHPTIRRLQHASYCGSLATLAVLQAAIANKQLPAWQADELITLVTTGVRAALRIMASLPGSGISEALVPSNERLDFDRLQRENRDAERGAALLSLVESARRQAMPGPSRDE